MSSLEAIKLLESPESSALLGRLRENASLTRSILLKANFGPSIEICGDEGSPVVHIRLRTRLSTREEEESVLQDAVDLAIKDGVMVTRSKYVLAPGHELNIPVPSIRVTASASHTKKEVEKSVGIVRDAVKKALKLNRL